jgi:hypothetical protein
VGGVPKKGNTPIGAGALNRGWRKDDDGERRREEQTRGEAKERGGNERNTNESEKRGGREEKPRSRTKRKEKD